MLGPAKEWRCCRSCRWQRCDRRVLPLCPDREGQGRGQRGDPLQLGDGLSRARLRARLQMVGDLLEKSLDLADALVHVRGAVPEPPLARVDEPPLSRGSVQLLLLQKRRVGYAVCVWDETLEGASALSFRVRRGTTTVLRRIGLSLQGPSHGTRDRRGLRRQGSKQV